MNLARIGKVTAVALAVSIAGAVPASAGTSTAAATWKVIDSDSCVKKIGNLRVSSKLVLWEHKSGRRVLKETHSVPLSSRGVGAGVVVWPSSVKLTREYPRQKGWDARRVVSEKMSKRGDDGTISFSSITSTKPVVGKSETRWKVSSAGLPMPFLESLLVCKNEVYGGPRRR